MSKGKDGSSGNAGSGGKASGGSSSGSSGASKEKGDTGRGAKADLKKDGSGQGSGGAAGSGGGSGSRGASGSSGQGSGGSSGSSGGSGKSGSSGSGGGGKGSGGSSGSGGGSGKSGKAGSDSGSDGAHSRTPLQRSRETGHGDGSRVRNVVDHVQAYAKGAKDGYQDKKEENGKEHARLDEAHAGRKAKQQDPKKDSPKGVAVTGPDGRTLVIAPPEEGDDGMSTDVKPLLVKEINANTLTLEVEGAPKPISRKELRNFKQYERKLEGKESYLVKVAETCKSLQAAAELEARDCQRLAEQAKGVEGGQKLAGKLAKLADAAKAQAVEAAELHKRARRAAEMCKVVLTNIGTRYAPLYKAVVDSDETKPAELRFYNDKGSYASAA
ncbi:hypothetical protein ABT354_36090 [Streptomyces sp. NPDC000594]|uniref:hypothetical protein n=1 Tax=Streptomyces sp. NPDC000594 TaxID=3154261 RepID=UPI00331877BE